MADGQQQTAARLCQYSNNQNEILAPSWMFRGLLP